MFPFVRNISFSMIFGIGCKESCVYIFMSLLSYRKINIYLLFISFMYKINRWWMSVVDFEWFIFGEQFDESGNLELFVFHPSIYCYVSNAMSNLLISIPESLGIWSKLASMDFRLTWINKLSKLSSPYYYHIELDPILTLLHHLMVYVLFNHIIIVSQRNVICCWLYK